MYIGTVKKGAKGGMSELEGMEIFILGPHGKKESYTLVYPLKIKDLEKFFKVMFEEFGKEWISDNYKYFLEYMLDEDCEIINEVDKGSFEKIRKFTKEDDKKLSSTLKEFKIKHRIYCEEENCIISGQIGFKI